MEFFPKPSCSQPFYESIISEYRDKIFEEEHQVSGHGHAKPEEDHTVCVKVGVFFVLVIIGFFVIKMIQ